MVTRPRRPGLVSRGADVPLAKGLSAAGAPRRVAGCPGPRGTRRDQAARRTEGGSIRPIRPKTTVLRPCFGRAETGQKREWPEVLLRCPRRNSWETCPKPAHGKHEAF